MKYHTIRKMDISNGPGVRISLFVQGCTFNCLNCFNPETHDFNKGKVFNDKILSKIIDLCKADYIAGLSILGGEPLHPKNIDEVTKLAKEFKQTFPDKSLWLWSGFEYEQLKGKEIFNYLDVLVDGRYVDELHDFTLKYRGSSNQRVIDIQKTLKEDKIILLEELN